MPRHLRLFAVVDTLALLAHSTLYAQTIPTGWRLKSSDAEAGTRIYEATGLPAGEQLTVQQTEGCC